MSNILEKTIDCVSKLIDRVIALEKRVMALEQRDVPDGAYLLEVVDVQQRVIDRTPNIVVGSRIVDGPSKDRLVSTGYSLTEIGRLKNLMIACGSPLDKFRASALLGVKYRGSVVAGTVRGETAL